MVLEMREHPGQFFSALQIGLNATTLLGGIVGDAAFSPFFQWLLAEILPGQDWGRISFCYFVPYRNDTLCNLCGSPPKTTGYCTSGSRSNVRCAPNALHHYALQTVRFSFLSAFLMPAFALSVYLQSARKRLPPKTFLRASAQVQLPAYCSAGRSRYSECLRNGKPSRTVSYDCT